MKNSDSIFIYTISLHWKIPPCIEKFLFTGKKDCDILQFQRGNWDSEEITNLIKKCDKKYIYGWVSNFISSHLLQKGRHQESLLSRPQVQI